MTRPDAREPGIPEKMAMLHDALSRAGLAHAFGGALALAWCVREVRATMDIDVNVFVTAERLDELVDALPDGVGITDDGLMLLRRDGQARLPWGRHPLDVFLNTTAFHEQAASRVHVEPLGEVDLPFLACRDLAVFKAFFDRGRDWVDLEAMAAAGALDVADVCGVLVEYLGAGDPRVARVRALVHG